MGSGVSKRYRTLLILVPALLGSVLLTRLSLEQRQAANKLLTLHS